MTELEREKTYLAKYLPKDLAQADSEIISDVYVPESADHAVLRLRRKGEELCITKKTPAAGSDSSRQHEHTIMLSAEEYYALAACSRKVGTKRRYYYPVGEFMAEIDIYLDQLAGLVVVDFEFDNDPALDKFTPPDFCLVDVTQDAWIAGGKLAGKTYQDLQAHLATYNYKPLHMEGEK